MTDQTQLGRFRSTIQYRLQVNKTGGKGVELIKRVAMVYSEVAWECVPKLDGYNNGIVMVARVVQLLCTACINNQGNAI